MKKLMLSVFALAAVIFSANAADNTDNTDNTNGTGKVILTTPLALEVGTNAGILDFGKLSITNLAATVTMTTGDVEEVTSDNGTGTVTAAGTAADYDVTGQIGSYFDVTYGACTLTGLHGATLTVTAFNDNAPSLIGETGIESFKVGGQLNIPANALVDTYSGPFTVTVTYN